MNNKGMTLIEVMIVLAIIAGMMAVFINKISNTGNEHKKSLRQFTLIAKNIQSKAKLYNSTFRLAINLGEDDEDEQAYWVERSVKSGIVLKGESPVEKALKEKQNGKSSDEDAPPPEFTVAKKVFKKPKTLLSGLRFKDVETLRQEDPITDGIAYIYFLPQGLADQAAIHFTNGEKEWTITVHPLTAKSEMASKYIRLKDIYKQ